MRLLVVAADIPVPPTSGGRVEIWRRIQALHDAGFCIGLICWFDKGRVPDPSEADMRTLRSRCDWVETVPITRSPMELLRRSLLLLREPSHAAAREVTAPMRKLPAGAQTFNPDAVLVDGLFGAQVAMRLACQLGKPLFYRSHNVEHQYMREQYRRQSKFTSKLGLLANLISLERFERRVIAHSVVVFDISLDDTKFWEQSGTPHVEWLPPAVDAEFAAAASRIVDPRYDILFFGNLHTPNNVEGLRWLVESVVDFLPSELKICVAGSRPTSEVRQLLAGDRRIQLLENPDQMADILAASKVIVNPVKAGSGVNIKSTEMLFTRAHLVSTPAGLKGLPEDVRRCFAIADDPAGFAQAIREGLQGARLNPESRRAAQEHFSTRLFPARVRARLGLPRQAP